MFLLAITFLHTLKEWDQRLFVKLNSEWTSSFFDSVVPYLRHPLTWSPFYLFLIVFALMNYRLKGLWWILFLACTVALTDLTGTYVFKSFFFRTRPCADLYFSSHVRLLLDHCSKNSSFISNHAANHFGMAMFIFLTLRHVLKNKAWIIFIWPALVAYAQVYVGIHYPLDVLAGSLVGLGWGYLIASAFNNQFGFAIFGNQPVE